MLGCSLCMCVCVHVQVSSVLRAEDSLCDLASVPLHQRSKSDLQEVSAPAAVLQREGKITHPSIHVCVHGWFVVVCVPENIKVSAFHSIKLSTRKVLLILSL